MHLKARHRCGIFRAYRCQKAVVFEDQPFLQYAQSNFEQDGEDQPIFGACAQWHCGNYSKYIKPR